MPKRMTNTELINFILTHAPTGKLAQAFVIEALDRYSKQVAEKAPFRDKFISGEAWKQTAVFIQQAIKENYGGHYDH